MIIYASISLLALIILLVGEKVLPNDTKKVYEEKGYNWNNVICYSSVSSFLLGIISSYLVILFKVPGELNPFFIPFATVITAYITVQSIMTDTRTLLINRYILRVAYLSMYIVSAYNVLTNPYFKMNRTALIIFTLVLIFIFLFSSIGASDVRAIAVALPYSISIGGYLAIQMLVITLLAVSLFMIIKRRIEVNKEIINFKEKFPKMYDEMGEKQFKRAARKTIKHEFDNDEEHAVPVGPYMIVPFLAFLLAYPILL